ncbi:MAG: hypothetical protein M0R66_03895 [Candidatus Omnitrophica bacterium]|nr:hypothetical protein [Candidatus Omnitrophota bacterium]
MPAAIWHKIITKFAGVKHKGDMDVLLDALAQKYAGKHREKDHKARGVIGYAIGCSNSLAEFGENVISGVTHVIIDSGEELLKKGLKAGVKSRQKKKK